MTYVGLTAVETIIRKSQVKERYNLEKKRVHTSRQQLRKVDRPLKDFAVDLLEQGLVLPEQEPERGASLGAVEAGHLG